MQDNKEVTVRNSRPLNCSTADTTETQSEKRLYSGISEEKIVDAMVEYILKHGTAIFLYQRANETAQTIWAATGRAEQWRNIE